MVEPLGDPKEQTIRLSVHARVTCLSWSCDGTTIAVCSTDGIVRLWGLDNLSTCTELAKLANVSKHFCAHFHPTDPSLLAVCDKTLMLVNASTGAILECDVVFPAQPINLAFNCDGTLLAVGTKSEDIYCFRLEGDCVRQVWKFSCSFEANQFAFLQDNSLVIASGPGTLNVLTGGEIVTRSIRCASSTAYSIAVAANHVAIGSADATVTIFKVDTLEAHSCVARPEWPIKHLSFSSDGKYLAAGSDDRFIDISSVPSGECVYRIGVNGGATLALKWHPNRHTIAYSADLVDKNGRPEYDVKLCTFPPQ